MIQFWYFGNDPHDAAALDAADAARSMERDLGAAKYELNRLLGLPPETVLRLADLPTRDHLWPHRCCAPGPATVARTHQLVPKLTQCTRRTGCDPL
jgi:hypothetical protein